jgi:hypothetical protein
MTPRSPRVLVGALAFTLTSLLLVATAGARDGSCRPDLRISSPKSGSTVEGALVVRYRIGCLDVRPGKPAYLRVVLPGTESPVRALKRLTSEVGSTSVAISKLETGQRDVRFTLLRANRTVADSVLVQDVLITGGRSAP